MGRGQARRVKPSTSFAEDRDEPEQPYEEPVTIPLKAPLLETEEGLEDGETIDEKMAGTLSKKICRRLGGLLGVHLWSELIAKYEADPSEVEAALLQVANDKCPLVMTHLKAASQSRHMGTASPSRKRGVPAGESEVEEDCEAGPEELPEAGQQDKDGDHDLAAAPSSEQPHPEQDAAFAQDNSHDPSAAPFFEQSPVEQDAAYDLWGALPMQALAGIDMATMVSMMQEAASYVQVECAKLMTDLEERLGQDPDMTSATSSLADGQEEEQNSWFSWEAWQCPCLGRRR